MNIREYLKHRRLLADGAMGTYYEKKYPGEGCPEFANTKHPERILQIHLEYLRAGARLLRTNTFAANLLFFETEEQILESVRAGYALAVQAVEQYRAQSGKAEDIFIAADIGPVYDAENGDADAVVSQYRAVCDAFLACGAKVFVFETQTDFNGLAQISAYIHEKEPQAFVITQFAFDKSGYTRAGIGLSRIVRMAAACDSVDAYGFNCGVGAAHLYQLLKKTVFPNKKYITALPNAGYPFTMRGKTIYAENEAYFVKMSAKTAQLGVDIIGGCCGTTPDYIKDLADALAHAPRAEKKTGGGNSAPSSCVQAQELSQGSADSFLQKLKNGEKPMIVELDPPFKNDITKVLDGAELLKAAGADMVTLSDSPMARARMDAGALAARIEREKGIAAMPHISCRDRNLIGLRSAIMGDYMNGIRHLLVVTGDPVERDARGQITGVFDVNSIRLMQYIREMNVELYENDPLVYGGALNYHGANPDAIIRRMQLKIDAGCSFFLTQPIYSDEDIARISYIKERIDTKILCGIMPLVSYKNAMFIHNEMPGIHIPKKVRDSYTPDMDRETAQGIAVRLSVELVRKLKDVADGYYFMTPFNRAGLIAQIMDGWNSETIQEWKEYDETGI